MAGNSKQQVRHNGRTTDAVPDEDDMLDLDTLEADVDLAPYRFRLAGRVWEMAHLNALDWSVMLKLEQGDMAAVLPALLGDQYDDFAQLAIPAWKLDRLVIEWGQHIGIPLEKLRASPPSSEATGKRSRPTSGATTKSGSRTSQPAR